MKNIKIWLLVLLTAFSSACEKDFDEINSNPNGSEVVPLTNVLLSATSQGIRTTFGAGFNMTYSGLWAQHYAKIQYIDEDWYEFRPDAFDGFWQGYYAGPIQDLSDVIAKAPNPSNIRAAAMTMRAYYFSIVTDMWGDVPYSEANDIDRVQSPKYDTQEAIYADLIKQLKDAATMFGQSDEIGAGDLLYSGDVTKWKKFANSLRARLLNRAKHKNAAYATELKTLLASPGDLIANNGENAQMTYPDATANNSNPLYNNKYNGGRNDHAVSKTLVDLLKDDPRISVYAEKNNTGIYAGQPNGTVEPSPFSAVSAIGVAFRDDPNAPSWLMTYAEVLFIKAEANSDRQAYLDAIAASCEQHGVEAEPAFLTAKGNDYSSNALEAIITQKWLSLFGNGAEAFTEFRRTGFPRAIVEVPKSAYPGKGVPKRFAYPVSEIASNKVNLEAAIKSQGVDGTGLFGSKMWWAL